MIAGGVITTVLKKRAITNVSKRQEDNQSFHGAEINGFLRKYIGMAEAGASDADVIDTCADGTTKDTFKDNVHATNIPASLEAVQNADENVLHAYAMSYTGLGIGKSGPAASKINLQEKAYAYNPSGDDREFIITEPYVDDVNGSMCITISAPVKKNGAIVGIYGIDVKIDSILGVALKTDMGYESEYKILLSKNDNIVANGKEAKKIMESADVLNLPEEVKRAYQSEKEESLRAEIDGEEYYISTSPVKEADWQLLSLIPIREIKKSVRGEVNTIIGVLFVSFLFLVALMYYAGWKIARPISDMSSVVSEMAQGDLTTEFTYTGNDELGVLADSIREMKNRLQKNIQYIEELSVVLGQMGQGNFAVRLELPYDGTFSLLKEGILDISSSLGNVIAEVQTASGQITSGAEQVAQGAQLLSEGSVEQASSVQELSANMEDISAKIADNAQKSDMANTFTGETAEVIGESNAKMELLAEAMEDITKKSAQIENIIEAIDSIAFQTNILALNAAVEAARAGEAGKGFAVVADEVRNLAGKSAESAKDIAELIRETISAVENGNLYSRETQEAIEKVREHSEKINIIIDEIADASQRQAENVQQITEGIEEISSVIQNNSATAEESAAASEELSGQTEVLNELLMKFKF